MKSKKRLIILTLKMVLFFFIGIKAQNKMLTIASDEFIDELQPFGSIWLLRSKITGC